MTNNNTNYSICITEGCGVKILKNTTLCPVHRALKQYGNTNPSNPREDELDEQYKESGLLQIAFNSNGRDFYPETVRELLEWREQYAVTMQAEWEAEMLKDIGEDGYHAGYEAAQTNGEGNE